MRGITQKLYDAWRANNKLPRRDVRFITADEIYALPRDEFWMPCGCDSLPDDLAIAVFDMAFNSSPWQAKRTLQRALGFKGRDVDGVIGVRTIAAANSTRDAVKRFLIARGGFYQEVILTRPDQVEFLEGWIKRLILLAIYTKGAK